MENPIRQNSRGLPITRCLRFEPLESRLPFAVDSMLVDTDLWIMPTSEPPRLAAESWMFWQEISGESIEEMEAFEDSLFDFVLRTPELLHAAIALSEGDKTWMLSPALPTDLASSIAEESLPSQFIPTDFEPDPFSDAQLFSELFTHSDIPPDDLLPWGWSDIVGLAIPLRKFGLAYFVVDDVVAIGTTTDGSNLGNGEVATERPRLAGGVFFFVSALMKGDSNLPVDNATINTAQMQEQLTKQSNQERRLQQAGRNDAFRPEAISLTCRPQQLDEHYQTFGELLRHNRIEIASDSQLTIEREQTKITRGSRSEENGGESRIEIAQVNARLPVSTLPEGMLPIGGEGWMDAFPRGRHLRLPEDFVVQTTLICDDLQAVAIPIEAHIKHSGDEIHSSNTPDQFYWVAIGGTIILTHTSFMARNLRDARMVKWLSVELSKFTKHDAK